LSVLLAKALPQPAQVMPDRVAMQDTPLHRVRAGGDGGGDPPLQTDEPLVAGRQRAGGDQDAAQMLERLAGGKLVQNLVRQRPLIPAEAFQQGVDLRAGQPGQRGVRTRSGRHGLGKGGQVGPDNAGSVAEQVAYPLVEHAALAGARAEPPGGGADRAAAPEVRVRVGAPRAQRLAPGAATRLRHRAAAAARHPAVLAAIAPG
jgi:hypothetical protein